MKRMLLLIVFPSIIFGTETRFVSSSDFQNIWLWQLSNTSVNFEKGISLPKNAKANFEISDSIWIAEKIDGKYLLGTSDIAKVISVDTDNNTTVIYSNAQQSLITAIKKFNTGLLIGSAPSGELIQLDSENKISTNISLTNSYIWDIVPTSETHAYIITGSPAELYEYSQNKLSEGMHISAEEHLLGGVYVDNTLWILGETALYKKQNNRLIAVAGFNGSASDFSYTNGVFYVTTSTIKKTADTLKKETLSSSLVSVDLNGVITELFSMQGFYFTSLGIYDKHIILGADQYGFYVEYDLVTKVASFSGVGKGKIVSVIRNENSFDLITGEPGIIWNITPNQAVEGSFISEVYDVINTSEWGTFDAKISVPAKTSIQFYVQSGATHDPTYWEDWVAITPGEKIPTPKSRYIRYKAVLKSSDGQAKPYVHSVQFPYSEINLAPSIENVVVSRSGRCINITWTAFDPNEDLLSYNIYLSEDGFRKVKLNDRPITNTNFTFMNHSYPSGNKRIIVEATDEISNTKELALTGQHTTTPILFDGDAPIIGDITRTAGSIAFEVTDKTSILQKVLLIIDGKEEIVLTPKDRIMDSKTENFHYVLPRWENVFIQIQAIDNANNINSKGLYLH